ncbi:hypothetical protein Taro_045849 [Colocasia esculenta]|uniref:Uncharacterized protein n=1 Tax=Colocasia esculenta TaxID=4460 RepID=A0A843X6W3_COLES|nr:hypothetical protein [Colocasia esculenta]
MVSLWFGAWECENSMLKLRFLEGLLRNPARLETRQPRRQRSCRDGASGRDMVTTLLSLTVACESLAEISWVVWDAEDGVGPLSGQSTAVTVVLLVSYLALTRRETSQQRQGARRAEETGR